VDFISIAAQYCGHADVVSQAAETNDPFVEAENARSYKRLASRIRTIGRDPQSFGRSILLLLCYRMC